MTPNPAGYYLPLPEPLEAAIAMLSRPELMSVITDLSFALNLNEPIETVFLEPIADMAINALTEANKIALLRWMCERLAWMQQGELNAQP
ncbi:MAG: hypothetical protein IM597_18705 [Pseudanabaena sp. M176S2SP2A07QC]|jgi:hypothetical protein|nr:hypothetical protein [Pseudanabaena sp. M176S2SP2A07QC]